MEEQLSFNFNDEFTNWIKDPDMERRWCISIAGKVAHYAVVYNHLDRPLYYGACAFIHVINGTSFELSIYSNGDSGAASSKHLYPTLQEAKDAFRVISKQLLFINYVAI
jgi:hypothetical protein